MRKIIALVPLLAIAMFCCKGGRHRFPPDDAMHAAGWDMDHAKRETPRWEKDSITGRAIYEIMYLFPKQGVFLKLDAETSETIGISGEPGRGPHPTSDTITLTPEWARAKLLSLNPYKIARGLIRMSDPVITYDARTAKYEVLFQRLDASGHQFEEGAAFFDFDPATSRITSLNLGVYLPEPAVTTGTMISPEQATSIALQSLLAHRSTMLEFVPDRMTFVHVPESTTVRVVERNIGPTTGTAVAYKISRFESRLTDPSYTGIYEAMKLWVSVDVFSGEVVAGDLSKMLVGGK